MSRRIEPSRVDTTHQVVARRAVGRIHPACYRLLLAAVLVGGGLAVVALGQSDLTGAAPTTLPEPIYWKQDLFLVPYQWGSAAEPGAAQAVWLYVSKDHGATWQKISEARPQVKAFHYRAEGDGEYWFAVRTIDHQGRRWPDGPYQPELRVIVDTTMPRIEELRAALVAEGNVEIVWRATDQHLDPGTWQIEAQTDAAGAWQVVPATSWNATVSRAAAGTTDGVYAAHVLWQPPAGLRPVALRATVQDRAGNSAAYQTPVAEGHLALGPRPSTPDTRHPTPTQPWTEAVTSRAPFRLSNGAANPVDDGVTAYGNPPGMDGVVRGSHDPALSETFGQHIGEVGRPAPNEDDPAPGTDVPTYKPLEPFRQASITRLPAVAEGHQASGVIAPTPDTRHPTPISTVQPKWVGARTFALEYDLEDVGHWGVSSVELWGTRDGGRTWHRYSRDHAARSPLVVTVDDEGLYGFRILVESAGSGPPQPPRWGDEPELWIAVDFQRPVVELTGVERGEGNLADHLTLRWRAADDNLEPRPIALFYSSRPNGPWSAIAIRLENTGQYAWRVERHVPARFHLRIEARDLAGNLAAFQTREPIEFAPSQPGVRLRGVEPIGPTAAGADSYR